VGQLDKNMNNYENGGGGRQAGRYQTSSREGGGAQYIPTTITLILST